MKKILRILILFVLFAGIFLINEVNAIDVEAGKNGVGNKQFRVIVAKGENVLFDQIKEIDEDVDTSRYITANLTTYKISKGDELQVYIYHEKRYMETINYTFGPTYYSVNRKKVAVPGSSWGIVSHAGSKNGINNIYVLGRFTIVDEGEIRYEWELDTSWKNIYITIDLYIEPEPQPEPPPSVEIVEPIINEQTECDNAEDNLGNDGLQVVICQGNFLDRTFSYNDNEGIYDIDLSTQTFSLENKIVFFIYAEQRYTGNVDSAFIVKCNDHEHCYTTLASTGVKFDKSGTNSVHAMATWQFKQAGVHNLTIELHAKNVEHATVNLKINVQSCNPPTGTNDFDGSIGTMDDELKNGQVGIEIIQNGLKIGNMYKYEGVETGKTTNVTVDNSKDGTLIRNTEFLLNFSLEKRHLDECSVTVSSQNKVMAVINKAEIDKSGTNNANVQIRFNVGQVGKHTIKFTVDTDEADVEVTLTVQVGSKLNITGTTINYESECEKAESELDNEGLKIIVSTATGNMQRKYEKITGNQQFTINPSTRVKFDKDNSVSVFVYYERNGIKDTDYHFGLHDSYDRSVITLHSSNSEVDTTWRNSFSGVITVNFRKNNIKNDIVTIPILMESKSGSETNTFVINIHIDFADFGGGKFDNVIINTDTYRPNNGSIDNMAGMDKLNKKTSVVLDVITNVGVIVSVIILTVLGVKYMLGSIEERADYKKDLVPYFVGACLLFGLSLFVKILQSIGTTINNI